MAASVQFRSHERNLGIVMREADQNLAIFLGMKNCEIEKNDQLLIKDSDEFDDSKVAEPKSDSLMISKGLHPEANQNEVDKSDCDWLLTQQSEISLLPSEEVEGQDSTQNQTDQIPNSTEVISPKSELANNAEKCAPPEKNSSVKRRPLLSSGERKPTPSAATPTERRPINSKPSCTSLATSNTTLTSSKPQIRSSTPSGPTIRSNSMSASRSNTPTRKPATPSTKSSASDCDQSLSGRKTGPTILKNPMAKTRPSKKPSEMLSLSRDASEIPKTLLPKRPASASRGRPATKLSSSNGKPRQKSCSPTKVMASNGNAVKNWNVMPLKSRGYSTNGGDEVNPVLMGTKMVERVVNMRKLAPPKQDDYVSLDKPNKSSLENSGFGRSLSKKSLDMAIRHMDIRRSISDSLRPIATGSSPTARGGQSSSSRSSTLESPITSSSNSSKSSNGINSYFLDGRRIDD